MDHNEQDAVGETANKTATADDVIAWLRSEEGRVECVAIVKRADELYARTESARHYSADLLNQRMTL